MMVEKVGGSFRDPAGSVFDAAGRILRGVKAHRRREIEAFLRSPFFTKNAGEKIVATKIIPQDILARLTLLPDDATVYDVWLEHQRVDFLSFPYEWSFELLKTAALFHLELHVEALLHGFDIIDASAYNIQFLGTRPIFIDLLSFRPYQEGVPWLGYKQFCEQFLAPLALTAVAGIDFNSWYLGAMEGIDVVSASKALPLRSFFSLSLLTNIHLHAWAISKASATQTNTQASATPATLPKKNYIAMLQGLHRYIKKLEPRSKTYWQEYAGNTSYSAAETQEKLEIVSAFVKDYAVKRLIDVGCNTGDYSAASLASGAEHVIGTDFDCGALNMAARRAIRERLNFTPIFLDVSNPSPGIGWASTERSSFVSRLEGVDASLSLALVHHIVIGKNVPLDAYAEWIVSLAPLGVTEFVSKNDPMVRGLLSHREDVFGDYNLETFLQCLARHADITSTATISNSNRTLIIFRRK